jgi:hypothetical protein
MTTDASGPAAPFGGEDLTDALSVLRDITEWSLRPDEWAAVSRAVSALSAALTAGDAGALRYEVTNLELLGPQRSHGMLAGLLMPAPEETRDRIHVATTLIEEAVALVPVTIYLSEGAAHAQVEDAVERLIAAVGLVVASREHPVEGSWYRKLWAREVAVTALGVAESRLVQQQDAQVTAMYMQKLPDLITALQPTKDAVVRVGAFLVVKVDWAVYVHQLTQEQQLRLNHSPELATAPREILVALGLPAASSGEPVTADDRSLP